MPLINTQARIQSACQKAGRNLEDVTLIAVSKVQPNARVEAVLSEGQRVFGENRVQEAQSKWPDFKARFTGVKLHLIGPLQSNKVKPALDLFDAIHTLDREFIQVNTGEEPQKAGVMPADVDPFIKACQGFDLRISGLMCIPPVEEEPSMHFALLAKMAKRNGLSGLSMGMSSDFESAIALGATHVRVGSAIFGERDKLT